MILTYRSYTMKKLKNTEKWRLMVEMRRRHAPDIGLADYYDLSDDWMYRRNRNLLYLTSRVSSDLDRIMDSIKVNTRRHSIANC